MIPVTKPFMPTMEESMEYMKGIWKRQWVTNNGPLANEYEIRLKEHLGAKHLLYLANGTLALQIAIKALGLRGEIITTPFSYVATTSSIVWEGCKPVFVDIDSNTLNIDPNKIEDAIKSNTSAILATHCFGNACDIDAIQSIADQYNLKVIYDASHCFGTQYKGQSILKYGDVSTLSLHATKPVHSIEGGAVVTNNPELLKRMAYMRNFGHDGPEKFNGVGINGKNSEYHAAMGLAVLEYVHDILKKRKVQSQYYDQKLKKLEAQRPTIQEHCDYNYAYHPLIFESEEKALKMQEQLAMYEIGAKRYFYPVLSDLDYVEAGELPVARSIAKRILCLPLYHDLSREEQDLIVRNLLRIQNYS